MKYVCSYIAILIIIPATTGCNHLNMRELYRPRGIIFSHTVKPLDINCSQTPRGPANSAKGDIKHLHYYVDIKWDNNAIGDIARQNGLETVYFVDMETLSVLGLWNQYTVHLYGDSTTMD